ncbi:MAG: hypothetical protein K6U80_11200 [Firmicutes bacterium]|nr:hypothetical protein [Bacillota bacterium]
MPIAGGISESFDLPAAKYLLTGITVQPGIYDAKLQDENISGYRIIIIGFYCNVCNCNDWFSILFLLIFIALLKARTANER